MPKATAVWLVENTALTFDQIAQFCGMHPLEVQGIADGEVAVGIIGQDPITSGLLAKENLEAAEKDASVKLKLRESVQEYIITQQKQKKRYTPVARRQDKPDAVAWLIKHHPELTDAQIVKLVGTTKSTIAGIRDRSHWNMQNIRPRDPVLLGLCQQTELQMAVDKALAAKERGEKKVTKAQKAEAKHQKEAPDAAASA
ncbi:MAG: DUF1013 domain-containing protein [Rickettsiales bacterium]|nr:DUF1013 domain-containing protein [Rickettsiales bacterium]